MPVAGLGAKQYGAKEPQSFAQYDYSLGLNIKKLPQQLDDRELTIALNVYLRAEGGIEMRKGIAARGALLSASPGKGLTRFWQQVVDGVPQPTPVKFLLAQIGGTLFNVDTGAQIGAPNALGASAKPWCVRRVYDPDTGGGTDVLVICTGSGGPYLFDGTTISTPAGWAAVASAGSCEVLNGILWFGNIPSQPNLLYGTQIGHPQTLVFYDLFTMSAPIVGLCAQSTGPQAGLVIGMNTGVATLYGTGLQNWYLQDSPGQDGVVAARTMIAIDGTVYFLGREAIYAYDGLNAPTPISTPVEPWILNDPLYPDFPMNGDRSTAFAWYYNRRLHVGYDSGVVGYPTAYLVYHLPNPNAVPGAYQGLQQYAPGGWTVLAGPKLMAACTLTAPGDGINASPLGCVVLDATRGQAYNWDVYNGQGTTGHNVDDAGTPIQAVCLSKYFKIGLPGAPKKMKRLYPELFVEQFDGELQCVTDYGSSSLSQLLSPSSTAQGIWDASQWDQANWAGGTLNYFKERVDVDIQAEAFAFGIVSSDTNPPWRFVGVTGQYTQDAQN